MIDTPGGNHNVHRYDCPPASPGAEISSGLAAGRPQRPGGTCVSIIVMQVPRGLALVVVGLESGGQLRGVDGPGEVSQRPRRLCQNP